MSNYIKYCTCMHASHINIQTPNILVRVLRMLQFFKTLIFNIFQLLNSVIFDYTMFEETKNSSCYHIKVLTNLFKFNLRLNLLNCILTAYNWLDFLIEKCLRREFWKNSIYYKWLETRFNSSNNFFGIL